MLGGLANTNGIDLVVTWPVGFAKVLEWRSVWRSTLTCMPQGEDKWTSERAEKKKECDDMGN